MYPYIIIVLLGRGPIWWPVAIAGRYQWEGLGGLGDRLPMVSRVSLGGLSLKIGEIKIASSDNSGDLVVGLSCVEP